MQSEVKRAFLKYQTATFGTVVRKRSKQKHIYVDKVDRNILDTSRKKRRHGDGKMGTTADGWAEEEGAYTIGFSPKKDTDGPLHIL